MNCKQCSKALTPDEIGLNYKLISRECTSFMCKKCLASYFEVDESVLDRKIEQFKRQNCHYFLTDEK